MAKRDRWGKAIVCTGIGIIIVLMFILWNYQWKIDQEMVIPQAEIQPEITEGTIEGYEEESDLIAYMIYQIENKNLDYALRGCAIEELSRYFSMTYYIQYTEQYPDLSLIPPSDYGSPAYEAITVSRLSNDYALQLENMFQMLGEYGHLDLWDITENVPENPDGMYYIRRSEICEILGARSIREMLVVVNTDKGPVCMEWTLVRYKRFWKLLLFNPLDQYKDEKLNLVNKEIEPMPSLTVNMTEEDVLPSNYYYINDCSEEEPEHLLRRFLYYLQRQDVWSALTYYSLYEQNPAADMAYFQRQSQAALEVQNVLYRILLPGEEKQAWYLRDLKHRAEDFVEEISTAQMIYVDYYGFEVIEDRGNSMSCRVGCGYNREFRWINFEIVYKNGWKIERIGI